MNRSISEMKNAFRLAMITLMCMTLLREEK